MILQNKYNKKDRYIMIMMLLKIIINNNQMNKNNTILYLRC